MSDEVAALSVKHDRYHAQLTAWTGHAVDPFNYGQTFHGFCDYWACFTLPNFTALEVCTPAKPHLLDPSEAFIDDQHGLLIVPPRSLWCPMAVTGHVVQMVRTHIGAPIGLRHTYRPTKFNAVVRGAPDSDHLHGCGWDLVFYANNARQMALELLVDMYELGTMALSIGHHSGGTMRLHLGVMAPRTLQKGMQRRWDYLTGKTDYLPVRLFGG